MALTAPLFSKLVDVIGRKSSVLLVAVPQLISWILVGVAKTVWVFYLARLVAGIGDAALFATIPIYVCEIAEPRVRGTWGNIVAISIYVGIFLINVIGAYYDIVTTAIICGCFPVLHVLLFCFMPESPYYLLMKNKEEEARDALRILRWRIDVDEELVSLKTDVARQVSETGTMKELFTIVSNRKALIMCLLIRVAQQFSGLPAYEVHTQYMFEEAGGDISEKTSAIILSGVLALSVGLSAFIVEKFGRKPLTIFSCFGCGIILAIETVYFFITQYEIFDTSSFGWLPLVGMLVYIVVCSTGIGILPTLILGEIFSASIKGNATSVMNIALAVCLLAVPKLFHSLVYQFGISAPFCFFTICCFASGIFSCFYVVETKGKTLEEIQQELKGNRKQKGQHKC